MQRAASRGESRSAVSEPVLEKVRIPFIQRAHLVWDAGEGQAFIIDLGLSGVFVEMSEALSVGAAVQIRFPLPGNEIPLTVGCRVAWRRDAGDRLVSKTLPPGVGLQFVQIGTEDRQRVREHVAEHCRREPKARQFLRRWPEAEAEGGDP